MMDPAKTLIIIPAYNEEVPLPHVLNSLRRLHNGHEVLVVDDGSVDQTSSVAHELGVRVARLPFNLGIGGALRTGFRYAVENGFERAVQVDADGQHDPAEIDRLLEALDGGADLVVGSRFASGEEYKVGHMRGGAMTILRLMIQILVGRKFTDTSSGFRAFSKKMLVFFARNYPIEYMDSTEALLLASYAGYEVMEVPIQMKPRSGGTPSNRNFHLAYHYLRLLIVLITGISFKNSRRRNG